MISCAFATQFSHMWPSAPAISICTSSLERLQNEQRIFDSFIAYKCTIKGAKEEGKKGYPVMNEVPFFPSSLISVLDNYCGVFSCFLGCLLSTSSMMPYSLASSAVIQ